MRLIEDDTLRDLDEYLTAIEREEESDPITPRGGIRIETGDLLTVYSERGATPDVTDVFGHYEDH